MSLYPGNRRPRCRAGGCAFQIKRPKPIILACLLAISACGQDDAEVIARISHDFSGSHELFSYRAKPSDGTADAEAISKKLYGRLAANLKSPSTMFMCTWRHPGGRRSSGNRPSEIFLACSFGPKPIKSPKSLVKAANLYNTIDRANLKANWQLENGHYLLSRFEVEIQANGKSYRSQNLAADMEQVHVIQDDMKFPENDESAFQFNLQSKLSRRQNSGNAQSEPIVDISISGTAEPIPNWLNY